MKNDVAARTLTQMKNDFVFDADTIEIRFGEVVDDMHLATFFKKIATGVPDGVKREFIRWVLQNFNYVYKNNEDAWCHRVETTTPRQKKNGTVAFRTKFHTYTVTKSRKRPGLYYSRCVKNDGTTWQRSFGGPWNYLLSHWGTNAFRSMWLATEVCRLHHESFIERRNKKAGGR